jgi:hypothetical protein
MPTTITTDTVRHTFEYRPEDITSDIDLAASFFSATFKIRTMLSLVCRQVLKHKARLQSCTERPTKSIIPTTKFSSWVNHYKKTYENMDTVKIAIQYDLT